MRWTILTGILALTLTGCASDFGTSAQGLETSDSFVVINLERCFRVPGDFTHPDPPPPLPPLIDGFADEAVHAPTVWTEDQHRSRLHAEFMLAEKLVDRGAPLRSDDIGILIAAGDALNAYDRDAYGPLIPKVQEFNETYSTEIPCEIKVDEGPIEGN